jgi:hypothetical protein
VVCPPEAYLRVGRALAGRRRLAAGVDAAAFASARAYAGQVRPDAPYELLCPGVVRMDPASAAGLERTTAGPAIPLPAAPRLVAGRRLEGRDFHTAFGAAVLGPVVGAFAHWAGRQWRPPAGGGTLVAVMRDGGLLGHAVARHAGQDVPEVWLSRSLGLLGAAAGAGDREALRNLLVRARSRPATVAEALDELGLAGECVPGLAPSAPLVGEGLERLLDWLAGTPAERVAATARAARRAVLEHLHAAGALRGSTLGLIDIGYSGTIQRCLTRIAALEGVHLRTLGLYLATSPGAVWAAGREAMVRGFAVQYGAPDWLAAPLIRSRAVLELLFGAPLGPLAGYDRGAPRLSPPDYPAGQREAMQRMQDAALANARPLGRAEVRRRLARLLTAPSGEEVRHVGRWLYQDHLTVARPQPLAALWAEAVR